MSTVVTFGIQKGGCAKSISAAVTAWILSESHKVLCVDMDSQGNMTEVFLQTPMRKLRLEGIDGVLAAIKEADPRPYIMEIRKNLHLLPGSEFMQSEFIDWLHDTYRGSKRDLRYQVLRKSLNVIKGDYDFIIIDTPPALGDNLFNALTASDVVVTMFDSGQFCYSAIPTFIESIEAIRSNLNPTIRNIGIVATRVDSRRYDNVDFIEMLRTQYGKLVFKTIIKQKAPTGRLAYAGFNSNPELTKAIAQYRPFVKEMLDRVIKES